MYFFINVMWHEVDQPVSLPGLVLDMYICGGRQKSEGGIIMRTHFAPACLLLLVLVFSLWDWCKLCSAVQFARLHWFPANWAFLNMLDLEKKRALGRLYQFGVLSQHLEGL
ncbi:hypothetical protein GOODEAATRI_004975 [Goodea atripinnis]|uniref:Uncharacterized protein n=1 Tax=Goodea atripinnis TaxID=208336 RepID=A0ABV0MF73_9TELE